MRTQGLQSCHELAGVFIAQDGLCHHEVNRPRILLAGAYGLIWAISLQNRVAERTQNQSQHEEIGWLALDYEDGLHGAPALHITSRPGMYSSLYKASYSGTQALYDQAEGADQECVLVRSVYTASHLKTSWRCVGANHRQLNNNPQYGNPDRNNAQDVPRAARSHGIQAQSEYPNRELRPA